jgi:hypothetical protein
MNNEINSNLYQDIMHVLKKHATAKHQYWNPNFLSQVNSLLDTYGKIEDEVVDDWISNMWSC